MAGWQGGIYIDIDMDYGQITSLRKKFENFSKYKVKTAEVYKVVLYQIKDILMKQVNESFREWQYGGIPWADFSESYKARKQGTSMLVETGALKAAVLSPDTFEVSHDTITIKTHNLPEYWIYHQYGTKRMPKRQILGVTAKSSKQIGDTIRGYFNEFLGRYAVHNIKTGRMAPIKSESDVYRGFR